jgi:hypothetical protein
VSPPATRVDIVGLITAIARCSLHFEGKWAYWYWSGERRIGHHHYGSTTIAISGTIKGQVTAANSARHAGDFCVGVANDDDGKLAQPLGCRIDAAQAGSCGPPLSAELADRLASVGSIDWPID